MSRAVGAACTALLLFASACGRSDTLKPAPNFELKDLSGKTVRLSDFKGKVVLLDFWATYCIPCHESIPALQKMQDSWKAQGFEVIGLSIDAFAEAVPDFVKEKGIDYTIVLDPAQTTPRRFAVVGLPTAFLIDRDGMILRKWTGYSPGVVEEIERAVKETLKKERAS